MTILTQAQSPELEGTGNSTPQGTPQPTSPPNEAQGSSAPATPFVSERRDAGREEDHPNSDGLDNTNDATQGNTGQEDDAHTTDQPAANHTPTPDPAVPDPDEDTDTDRKLQAVYGDTIH